MAQNNELNPPATLTRPFADLGEVEKRVLSYAAAIGREFDFSVLSRAIEMEEEPLAETLEQLVQHGVLKELKEGDSYMFIREETLAQAYGEISSSRLRVIHKKIAEALEKLHPDPTPDLIPEMGRQFHLGRVHDKSLLYNRYAATLAVNAFSPDVAIRYLERAREDIAALPGDHKLEEADVLKELGGQYDVLGEESKADELYGESLAKLPDGEVTARALTLLSRADVARGMDKIDLTRQYCEEAIRLLEKVGHKKGLALAHRALSRAAFRAGQIDVCKREIEATLTFLDPEKDAKEVARCYIQFGNVHSMSPEPEQQAISKEYYQKAVSTLERLRDYRELSRAYNNLALSLSDSEPREALRALMESRAYAEKAKDARLLGWALFNSVEIHLSLGETMDAAMNNMEAGRILSKINDKVGMEQIALNEGILAQNRKAYEDSEKAYVNALKQAEGLGYPQVVVEVLVHFASMYVDWGKKDEALKEMSRIRQMGENRINPANLTLYELLKKQLGI
jgi:tetratricopeptide (TPR) repeat protein